MVLNPIPQSLPVHFFGSRPQPPTSPGDTAWRRIFMRGYLYNLVIALCLKLFHEKIISLKFFHVFTVSQSTMQPPIPPPTIKRRALIVQWCNQMIWRDQFYAPSYVSVLVCLHVCVHVFVCMLCTHVTDGQPRDYILLVRTLARKRGQQTPLSPATYKRAD